MCPRVHPSRGRAGSLDGEGRRGGQRRLANAKTLLGPHEDSPHLYNTLALCEQGSECVTY